MLPGSLQDLDKLDASRKVVPRPPTLPRNREEDDVLLDRVPLPLDTDEIAPGPKSGETLDHRPSRPFSSLVDEIITSSGGAREGVATLKPSRPPQSGFVMTAPEPESPQAKPMGHGGHVTAENRGEEQPKKPPSPFRVIRRLQRRVRRASDPNEENPFEDIATRAPPRNAREKMTREDMRKLREELALKPLSAEVGDDHGGSDFTETAPKETISERHLRRPQVAPTEEKFDTDLRTTPAPSHMARTTPTPLDMPTLVPTVDRAPRLPNNPFSELDISKPTVTSMARKTKKNLLLYKAKCPKKRLIEQKDCFSCEKAQVLKASFAHKHSSPAAATHVNILRGSV
ncbi:hypothetical protein ANCCEY_11044 [Ancylostoma ceylanicum]|uniref:Uncharacterized protein n=1 Tax=Ancylostoma ceylanicum TaxID=53326 RepID=A0A0D6LCR8_9BILA|nr:hypothetical protein ANCCEY_11044 [Ancylostoma ceylanicum]